MATKFRPPTMGEIRFQEIYPSAIRIDTWYDFKLYEAFIEIKDCFRKNSGRFVIIQDHHDQLQDEGGWYCFILKKNRAGRGKPVIKEIKWIPACGIDAEVFPHTEMRHEYNDYTPRDIFRIPWRWVWPVIEHLDIRN